MLTQYKHSFFPLLELTTPLLVLFDQLFPHPVVEIVLVATIGVGSAGGGASVVACPPITSEAPVNGRAGLLGTGLHLLAAPMTLRRLLR